MMNEMLISHVDSAEVEISVISKSSSIVVIISILRVTTEASRTPSPEPRRKNKNKSKNKNKKKTKKARKAKETRLTQRAQRARSLTSEPHREASGHSGRSRHSSSERSRRTRSLSPEGRHNNTAHRNSPLRGRALLLPTPASSHGRPEGRSDDDRLLKIAARFPNDHNDLPCGGEPPPSGENVTAPSPKHPDATDHPASPPIRLDTDLLPLASPHHGPPHQDTHVTDTQPDRLRRSHSPRLQSPSREPRKTPAQLPRNLHSHPSARSQQRPTDPKQERDYTPLPNKPVFLPVLPLPPNLRPRTLRAGSPVIPIKLSTDDKQTLIPGLTTTKPTPIEEAVRTACYSFGSEQIIKPVLLL